MSTRITQQLMVDRSLFSLQTGLGRLAESQEHLSTGRLINRPSDSPTGTNDAMRLRGQLAANAQYAQNAQDGISFLGRTDSTLMSMVDYVQKARDLILQGSSTGSAGPDARAALATELEQIREGLIGLANTQHMGRPLFGGTAGARDVYVQDAAGTVTFTGDQNEVTRTIGDGQDIAVNVTGPAAFGPDGSNIFDVLAKAITDMTANPDQLDDSLAALDVVQDTMLGAVADAGTRYGRIEAAQQTIADAELDHTAALSAVENVDIAKAIVNLQMQEVAYQAALGATARVLQPSLMDFLR